MKTILSCLFTFFSMQLFAQLLVIDSTVAIKDNSIFAENNNSNGAGPVLFGGKNGLGNSRRALIKFSALNVTPDSFKSVSVRIHVNQVSNATLRTLSLYKLTSDWGEGTSSNSGGTGAAPSTGDATWNFRFFNTQSWTTAGGDYFGTPSASIQVGDVGYYTFSDPQLLADYKSWINNPGTNFGWILLGDEAANNSAKRLDSREVVATAPLDAPKIFATYNPVVVPVTITSFRALDKESFIQLAWQTSTEVNTSLFEIEHSSDGIAFEKSGVVSAAGNSSQQRNYTFNHYINPGKHLYRIVTVNHNGKKEYSAVITINNGGKVKNPLSIFPNPVDNFLNISSKEVSLAGRYRIFDLTGKVIRSDAHHGEKIDVTGLKTGYYTLELLNGGKALHAGFLKK